MSAEPPSWSVLPTLVGDGVALRQIKPSDCPALLRIFGDAQVTRFMGIPLLADLAGAEALRAQIDDGLRAQSLFQWGVVRVDDAHAKDGNQPSGTLLGTCTLHNISWSNERIELGFALGREHWGQGVITRALPRLFEHVFDELGMHRLEADVDPRNTPSLRRLAALGFQREGFLRGRHLIAGERQDTVLMALLAPEWRAR